MQISKFLEFRSIASYSSLNSIRYVRKGEFSGSQRRTLSYPAVESEELFEDYLSKTHWTLSWKNKLSFREKCFVVECLILRMLVTSYNLGDYLLLSEILFIIRDDSKDFYQQRLRVLGIKILETSSSFEEKRQFAESLYGITGTDLLRKYGTLRKTWSPERHLARKDVPVDVYMDMSSEGVPYSSYCKGYGEGSSRGPKKTPLSYELDGEEEEAELESRILFLILKILTFNVDKSRNLRSFEA